MNVLVLLAITGTALLAGFVPHPHAFHERSSRDDRPKLKDVVRRMSAYVESYGEKASIVVATEHYTQEVMGSDPAARGERRETVAEFAILKAQGFGGWVGFRDVIEVDGRSLTDRKDRLIQVLTSAAGAHDEARRLSAESARFNIGPIVRDFNVPTSALFFFTSENLERFRFSGKQVGADDLWEIAFRETERPTLIRTPGGRSVPASGRVWVNAASGIVLRTRLVMTQFATPSAPNERGSASAEIDVTYSRVPDLGMWLPATMTEVYEVARGRASERTNTEARYTDYRQFRTSGRVK
jgi:hypothetical protein